MKKTVLVGINAKFIHSNLALRYIKTYYAKEEGRDELVLLEYSINQQLDYILQEILIREPEVVAFSCYLWNIEFVRNLSKTLKKVNPDIITIYGGPEVMYNAEDELLNNKSVDYLIQGEGEETVRHLINYLNYNGPFPSYGLSYRDQDKIHMLPPGKGLSMGAIPFPYDEELTGLDNRILYYETSRGCPFNCQYCLSSIEAGVRFRPLNMVTKELQFFLDKKVKQVKFVDRTFNTKEEHALGIMEYVITNDNGVTNFHFEVAPELMSDGFIKCLSKARKGLFQLEVGIQTINVETLEAIKRKNQLNIIQEVVENVHKLKNTHTHLDLIAGLPLEDYDSFSKSFNFVFSLQPNQLQLGFLKVLKGSGMMKMAEKYGIIYREYAPYEVLLTNEVTYQELEQLKIVEEMVELFYNSGQFQMFIASYLSRFDTPFKGFETMAKIWLSQGMQHMKHTKLDLYEFLYDLSGEKELLMYDYCLNEKPRKKSDWMDYHFIEAPLQKLILDGLNDCGIWLEEAKDFNKKQLSRMYHMDTYKSDNLPKGFEDFNKITLSHEHYSGSYMVVNYKRRDFIHNNGEVVLVEIKENDNDMKEKP